MFSHSSQLSLTRSLGVYKFKTEVAIWFVNQSFFLVRYLVHKSSMSDSFRNQTDLVLKFKSLTHSFIRRGSRVNSSLEGTIITE